MLFIIGLIIVFASVIIGYLMHYGDLMILWQPNELVIIIGAGIGASIISNPPSVLKRSIKSLKYLFKGSPYNRDDYLELLVFSFKMFTIMKNKGAVGIEQHIENPENSELFQDAESIAQNKETKEFICNNLRLLTMGLSDVNQFEEMIDDEIEVFEEDSASPSKAYLSLGDSLPALGIVAAVLGVIVTMRSILEPPEILGSLIASALVGTFTGVLFAYGLFLPIGHFLKKYSSNQVQYLECIKSGIIGYLNKQPTVIIVEYMRKTIPDSYRPSFLELEEVILKNKKTMNK